MFLFLLFAQCGQFFRSELLQRILLVFLRLLGGTLYLAGMVMFAFNIVKTIKGTGQAASSAAPTPAPAV